MVFLLACSFMLVISYLEPSIFSDSNQFLAQFVNHEYLNFMAVMVTITLASTANIHIELRKKEKLAGKDFLTKTKAAVRKSAFSLIWALSFSVILVFIKPLIPQTEFALSLVNSLAIATIIWSILVILDITKLAFKM